MVQLSSATTVAAVYDRRPEPHRGSVIQPRVGRVAGYPGYTIDLISTLNAPLMRGVASGMERGHAWPASAVNIGTAECLESVFICVSSVAKFRPPKLQPSPTQSNPLKPPSPPGYFRLPAWCPSCLGGEKSNQNQTDFCYDPTSPICTARLAISAPARYAGRDEFAASYRRTRD